MIGSFLRSRRRSAVTSPIGCWAGYGVLRWVLDQPRSTISVLKSDLYVEIECLGYVLTFDRNGEDLDCLSMVDAPEGKVWRLEPAEETWDKPGFPPDSDGPGPMIDPADADLLSDEDWSKLKDICSVKQAQQRMERHGE